ncbi:uncharacterized protein BDW47DRAFT_19224 [Aspergillus candidus]|uniref:P-loop containing nucleoside triphosphate hydrolase protein n=1 Tax=Aspergillus candidus TaxID=41067 RepID=A0A2I2FEJ3_ASPCN|nr:hypothetical protein BDW47DRAFT_19224 [Aspergillus candidus]PLB39046.1 hypothetical protein BDW47DRAFT_19224 [Aspergillus candidus]
MTVTAHADHQPDRLLLVSVPRTASNLFVKILDIDHQPNVHTNQKHGYFYYPAFLAATMDGLPARPIDTWPEATKTGIGAAFQSCFDTLEECATAATQQSKTMFAKEHAFWMLNPAAFDQTLPTPSTVEHHDAFRPRIPERYGPTQTYSPGNNTVMSDEYLRTWRLAFIIRHPALAWPSFYRAMSQLSVLGYLDTDGVRGASRTNMTLRWTRALYDWAVVQRREGGAGSAAPVVIDAHEVIHSPAAVERFCETAGLDSEAVQFEWAGEKGESKHAQAAENEMQVAAAKVMLGTLDQSSGIVKGKAPATVDVAVEAEKWREEFGEEVAGWIEQAVLESMPDYEYLRKRCIR